ncbi:MAG: hypothetical protein J4451_01220 [DPANN group archaeon]|nr:hypothetical protein [DPANN group archaeon]
MDFLQKKAKVFGGERSLPKLPELPKLTTEEELPAYPMLSRTTPDPVAKTVRNLKPITTLGTKSTVFINIKKYKDIMGTIEDMQGKIEQLKNALDRISQIKTKEAEIVAGWNALLREVQEKAAEVDSKLDTTEEL